MEPPSPESPTVPISPLLRQTPARIHDQLLECRSYDAMTILANLPVESPERLGFPAMLVDVSYELPSAHSLVAGQSSISGRSGALVSHSHYDELLSIKSELIDDDTATRFRNDNTPVREHAVLLVRHDKRRHGDFARTWDSDDAPPVGKYVHNIPLSPYRRNVCDLHSNPVVGVAYTITDSPALSDSQKTALVRTAQAAGDIVTHVIAEALDFKRRLADTHSSGTDFKPRHPQADGSYRTIGAFLIVHHHFYPAMPIVYELLHNLTQDRDQVRAIYARYGALYPGGEARIRRDFEFRNAYRQIAADLFALTFVLAPEQMIPRGSMYKQALTLERLIDEFARRIAEVAVALTGVLTFGLEGGGLTQDREPDDWNYVCLLPRSAHMFHEGFSVPVFKRAAIERILYQLGDTDRAYWPSVTASVRSQISGTAKSSTEARPQVYPRHTFDVPACVGTGTGWQHVRFQPEKRGSAIDGWLGHTLVTETVSQCIQLRRGS